MAVNCVRTLTAHGRQLCPAGRISIMTIAFICTGTMGRPMLANLVRKGFAVTAYDVVPGALDAAVKAGATAASSSAGAARGADLIVTMLPSSSHVESVYLGNGGVLEGAAS